MTNKSYRLWGSLTTDEKMEIREQAKAWFDKWGTNWVYGYRFAHRLNPLTGLMNWQWTEKTLAKERGCA